MEVFCFKTSTYVDFDPLKSTLNYQNLGRKTVEKYPKSVEKTGAATMFATCHERQDGQKKTTVWWFFDWSARQELNLKPGLRRTV